MSTYPMVKFMASPSSTATARFDFNAPITSGRTQVMHDGFDLGSAPLEGEPDGIEVSYGLREISFTLRVYGTHANAMPIHTKIARELLRPDNWLMVDMAADKDAVWFHTYRASSTAISLENVSDSDGPDAWDISITVSAEPFAYGERVTLSPITITNNPSSGTNRCRAALPTILGDAPAPLRIEIDPSNANYMDGFRLGFFTIAAETAPAGPIVWQVGGVDGWTAGTDTGASGADAAMSGGTRRRVSFATDASMVNRLSGPVPATLPAGAYKVLVRCARSDTASTFALRFGQAQSFAYWYGDVVVMDRASSTAVGHATWVDLGEFTHPRGYRAPAGQSGVAYAPDIALQAQRLTGAGSLDLDVFLLVPLDVEGAVESRTLYTEFPVSGPANGAASSFFDGDEEIIWGFNSAGGAHDLSAEIVGQFPRVTPGVDNVIHFLQQVNGRKPWLTADTPDVITNTTVLTISYHPRWLYLGDG